MINFRENVRSYLFQGRFSSCPVSTDTYLLSAIQYIVRNPIKAGIVRNPWEYQWSGAAYHCGLVGTDILIQENELLKGVANWEKLLGVDSEQSILLEEKNRTGRPFGPEGFYTVVEKLTGCDTKPGKPGRPAKK